MLRVLEQQYLTMRVCQRIAEKVNFKVLAAVLLCNLFHYRNTTPRKRDLKVVLSIC